MAFATEIAADSPLIWWRLGEAVASQANDASGNGFTGQIYNVFTTWDGFDYPGMIANDLDTCYQFTAADTNAIYRPQPIELRDASAFVFEGCFNFNDPNETFVPLIIAQPQGGCGIDFNSLYAQRIGASLFLNSAGRIEWRVYEDIDVPKSVVQTDDIRGTGDHIIQGRWSGTDIYLYVDDVEIGSVPCAAAWLENTNNPTYYHSTNPSQIYVGAYRLGHSSVSSDVPNAGFGTFRADEIAIYDHDVSPARLSIHAAEAGLQAAVQTPQDFASIAVVDTRVVPAVRSVAVVNTSQAASFSSTAKVNTGLQSFRSTARVSTLQPAMFLSFASVDTETDLSVAHRKGVKWKLIVEIDGIDRTNLWAGRIATSWEPGKVPMATIDLVPPSGVIDPADYDGKPLVIWYRDIDNATGNENFRLIVFSGDISDAVWVPGQSRLQCKATPNNQARFAGQPKAVAAREIGGEYSPRVYAESAHGWDHVKDRIETLQADVWLRFDQGIQKVAWKTRPHEVEWADEDHILRVLRHEPARRSRIVNSVDLRADYRFKRLRQRTLRCRFSHGMTFCERLLKPFKICQRSMIDSASKSGNGWQRIGEVSFVPVPGPGSYRCFPYGPNSAQKYLLWGGDAEDAWAWEAYWTIGRRWEQEVTELHTWKIIAPDSVAANGEVWSVEELSVESEQDNTEWLAEKVFSESGSDFVSIGTGLPVGSSEIVLGDRVKKQDNTGPGNRDEFDQAMKTEAHGIAAEMVLLHRHKVTIAGTFDPRIKPGVRPRINAMKQRASGELTAIRQVFDRDSGRAITEFDIGPFVPGAVGLTVPSTIEAPSVPDIPADEDIPDRLYFPARIGGLTNSQFYNPEWTGYTANYEHDPTDTDPFNADPDDIGARRYERKFRVEYPTIPESHLRAIDVQANRRIEVEIPNDELVRIQ